MLGFRGIRVSILTAGLLLAATAAANADSVSARGPALAGLASGANASTAVACNQGTFSGRLDAGDPRDAQGAAFDLYRFTAEEGEIVTLSLAALDFDGLLAVYDPDGRPVEIADGVDQDAFVAVEIDRSGTWSVAAAPSGAGAGGDYRLAVACLSLPPVDYGPCSDTDTSLCLNGGRFRVEALWETQDGNHGPGHMQGLTEDTGSMWFFRDGNVEVVVKVLDGCGVNQHYWVFAGGLTNVHTILRVTDTQRRRTALYFNPQGRAFEPVQDTGALACG